MPSHVHPVPEGAGGGVHIDVIALGGPEPRLLLGGDGQHEVARGFSALVQQSSREGARASLHVLDTQDDPHLSRGGALAAESRALLTRCPEDELLRRPGHVGQQERAVGIGSIVATDGLAPTGADGGGEHQPTHKRVARGVEHVARDARRGIEPQVDTGLLAGGGARVDGGASETTVGGIDVQLLLSGGEQVQEIVSLSITPDLRGREGVRVDASVGLDTGGYERPGNRVPPGVDHGPADPRGPVEPDLDLQRALRRTFTSLAWIGQPSAITWMGRGARVVAPRENEGPVRLGLHEGRRGPAALDPPDRPGSAWLSGMHACAGDRDAAGIEDATLDRRPRGTEREHEAPCALAVQRKVLHLRRGGGSKPRRPCPDRSHRSQPAKVEATPLIGVGGEGSAGPALCVPLEPDPRTGHAFARLVQDHALDVLSLGQPPAMLGLRA